MAKTTQDYSPTAASNTALIAPDGTQIPLGEGQTLPKHVNDAFRALMADTAIAAKFSGLPAGRSTAVAVKLVSNTDTLGSFPAVGGQKLELDGAVNPALVLAGTTAAPHTYTFDTSDSSMTAALRFYEDASQTTEYTTGVTVSSGQTTIAVTDTAPKVLYYQLAGSAGLGGIAYVLGVTGQQQTAAEIKTAYESNADTNAFTDAEQTKLAGIEPNADVTDEANVTAAGALMDSEVTNLAQVKAFDSADYATAAQGATADTAVQPNDSPTFADLTLTGYLAGPATFTIDPAVVGDDTGKVVIAGDLQVDGDTTTVNSTTVEVGDKNIVLGADATADTQNHGAGITISRPDSTNAGISWDETSDEWDVSNGLDVAGNIKVSGTVDGRDVAADGTKLDGIAAGATAFDGQYSSLTGTPTLGTAAAAATTDFATAAQGATADTAVQPNDSPTFGTVTADGLSLGDNDAATFGGGNDLQIWHDGNNSNIAEVGTGDLNINAQNLNLADGAPNYNYYFRGIAGGEARLYHNGSQKLATKSTGVDVTGNVTADGLTVSGTSYIQSTTQPQLEIAYNSGNITGFYRSGGDFQIKNDNGAGTPETSILLGEDGAVTLYYDDAAKLATTSTGVDVTGTVTADDSITISRQSVAPALFFENSSYSGGDAAIKMFNAGQMVFETDATTQMVLDAAGNVGMGGNTSPATALDVTGTVTADQYDTDEALPTSNPSLSLDFGNAVQIDPRVNFSRASIGTYFDGQYLRTAGPDEPRIEYAADGTVKGLLIEEERTNLVPYSATLSNWGGLNTQANSGVASVLLPDGSTGGVSVSRSSPSNMYKTGLSVSASSAYTASIFVKADVASSIKFGLESTGFSNSGVHTFDLSNGSVNTLSNWTASIDPAGNDWWRLSVSATTSSGATSVTLNLGAATDNQVFYAWGAQLEAGPFATSYIPTNGSTATREPDIATVPVSEFAYNQSAGTVVVEAELLGSDSSAYPRLWDLGTATNTPSVYYHPTAVYLTKSGVSTLVSKTWDKSGKVGTAMGPDGVAITTDGATAATSSTTVDLAAASNLTIGSDEGRTDRQLNGHIRSLKYWPQRLSDATLQAVTQG